MNKSKLKAYAPQARKDFIAAVTARAAVLGITAGHISPVTVSGGVALIEGVEWPAKVAAQRQGLIERIARHRDPHAPGDETGFAQTMEEVAYTWFNRFAALRYMELHDLLGHGHRVLSSRDGGLPELLRHAADVHLPGLQAARVQELQLAGNQDNALYKLLLVAQCNELSRTMPFLFEHIDDDTELLLPDHLLHTDSIIAKLVAGVPEDDWQEIEAIGWLYQFYISEKKDQVIGKVVKSEDIPAATQLFTPNWIVQYLVQNSVGRLWLMANPHSTLASQWPYYIHPAEQEPEVQAQLDALIQTRVREDGDTLNPETITVLDPACGSGHILVVAYDVLKAIYLERGYRLRDIPRLILEKNLYGLDIDDRAAQLAGFALLMKARADDRRLLADPANPPKLNVLALQESTGLDAARLANALYPRSTQVIESLQVAGFEENDLFPATRVQMRLGEGLAPQTNDAAHPATVEMQRIQELIDSFAHAKTFGSLIKIGLQRAKSLRKQLLFLDQAEASGDLYAQAAAQALRPLVRQAQVLAMQFDAVVANPPYMGSKGMNPALKDYAKATFPDSKSDLFAMFMERGFEWCKPSGFNSMVTMQSWMFLSSYEAMREKLLTQRTIQTMAHLGARAFAEISGEVVQTTAFVLQGQHLSGFKPAFFRLVEGQEAEKETALRTNQHRFDATVQDDFKKIPGSPVAYWATTADRVAFSSMPRLGELGVTRKGMVTARNEIYVREWYEVSQARTNVRASTRDEACSSGAKWFPYLKGGSFRKWYGNFEHLVDWENDGQRLQTNKHPTEDRVWATNFNLEFIFTESITWTTTSSSHFGVRFVPKGSLFDAKGSSAFVRDDLRLGVLGYLASSLVHHFLRFLNPTIEFQPGDLANLPVNQSVVLGEETRRRVESAVLLARTDWDAYERSWDFQRLPILRASSESTCTLESSYASWIIHNRENIAEMKGIEEENNHIFIDAYGLADELSSDVPLSQITLTANPAYRYGGNFSEAQQWAKFREDTIAELISYAIGCMMGRYSLDAPGLIYAHAGNVGFDPSRYTRFAADADGILPVTDEHWFADDAPERIREFLLAVWGPDTLEENMAWLAESLGAKAAETPAETIRRYIADKFFKDHLQTYKKRPIYWLFSSGKQGAFQALVYLHRYNESTLARMRTTYVVPLTTKITARLEMLEQDATATTSTAARTKLRKQMETLRKKQTELLAFDEKLRHYADMRITLDLDDGVKVNYGKFGDLLEGVKAVTGGSGDE